MIRLIVILALFSATSGLANELNQDVANYSQRNMAKQLPQTLVIRVKTNTNEMEVLHSNKALAPSMKDAANLAGKRFRALGKSTSRNELDQDTSVGSWYFRYNYGGRYWFSPFYYYGGYNFNYYNYWGYNYGGYNYYYYGWRHGYYGNRYWKRWRGLGWRGYHRKYRNRGFRGYHRRHRHRW